MRTLLVCATILILTGCGSVILEPEPRERAAACLDWLTDRGAGSGGEAGAFLRLSGSLGCFDGKIPPGQEAGGTQELAAWAREPALPGEGKLLAIRSRGGEAGWALGIAEDLQEQGAALLAVDVCASSCANYFYAGLADRHVTDGMLLIFHGGFSEESKAMMEAELDAFGAENPQIAKFIQKDKASILADMDQKKQRQDALLRRADADPAVIHGVDALDLTTIQPEDCGGDASVERAFVFFGDADMRALGTAPRSGRPAADAFRINEKVARLTKEDDHFVVCRAPSPLP
jgi:hypothetical protein